MDFYRRLDTQREVNNRTSPKRKEIQLRKLRICLSPCNRVIHSCQPLLTRQLAAIKIALVSRNSRFNVNPPFPVHVSTAVLEESQAWFTLVWWKYSGDCCPVRPSDFITISVLSWLVWYDKQRLGKNLNDSASFFDNKTLLS